MPSTASTTLFSLDAPPHSDMGFAVSDGADTESVSDASCPSCGGETLGDDGCDSCVQCDRCGALTPDNDDTITTARGHRVCESCRTADYTQCGNCDAWNRDDVSCGNGCDDDDAFDDDDDDDDFDDVGGRIHGYYYKPEPVFHGCGPLYLGAEIEVATPGYGGYACVQSALDHLGRLGYLKDDSSIGGGFEIVTHPMSYDWAIDNFPWQLLTDLRDQGCEATDSTGMHVHLSRAGFSSQYHIYRWMKFIYRNEAPVTALARRRSNEWAAFTQADRKFVKDYAKGGCGARYRAINTNNADTFELRIFASSLHPTEVQAALGFAAASVEYTRDLNAYAICRHRGWSWAAFADWVAEQPAYAPLHEQMEALACAF
jgi:hypothetical protein